MHALKGPGFEKSQAEHLKILQALKQRNPEKSRKAMQAHLNTYWRKAKVFLHSDRNAPKRKS